MCAGVEGGFQMDEKKFVFEEQLAVVVLPQWHEIKMPNVDLPEVVSHNTCIHVSFFLNLIPFRHRRGSVCDCF